MINNIYIKILYYFIGIIDLKNKLKIKNFFLKKFNRKEIILFDIGAHKGETIDFFTKFFNIKKIFAFEPNYNIFLKIRRKYYKKDKIKIYNFGVGDFEYEKKLNIFNDTSSSTFTELNENTKYFKRKNRIFNLLKKEEFNEAKNIKIISLNKFLEENHLEKVDILKIDTEGYEYKILKGLSEKNFAKVKFIYFEHHYDLMLKKNYTFFQIKSLLEKNNFEKVYKIKMSFRKTFEYIYENKSV